MSLTTRGAGMAGILRRTSPRRRTSRATMHEMHALGYVAVHDRPRARVRVTSFELG
jgi:hypothetical protein